MSTVKYVFVTRIIRRKIAFSMNRRVIVTSRIPSVDKFTDISVKL